MSDRDTQEYNRKKRREAALKIAKRLRYQHGNINYLLEQAKEDKDTFLVNALQGATEYVSYAIKMLGFDPPEVTG